MTALHASAFTPMAAELPPNVERRHRDIAQADLAEITSPTPTGRARRSWRPSPRQARTRGSTLRSSSVRGRSVATTHSLRDLATEVGQRPSAAQSRLESTTGSAPTATRSAASCSNRPEEDRARSYTGKPGGVHRELRPRDPEAPQSCRGRRSPACCSSEPPPWSAQPITQRRAGHAGKRRSSNRTAGGRGARIQRSDRESVHVSMFSRLISVAGRRRRRVRHFGRSECFLCGRPAIGGVPHAFAKWAVGAIARPFWLRRKRRRGRRDRLQAGPL